MEEKPQNFATSPQTEPFAPPSPDLNGSSEMQAQLPPGSAGTNVLVAEFDEVDAQAVAVQALREKSASSVSVMYAVMAFSLLNSALIAFGSPLIMAFGLTISDFIAYLAKENGYIHLLWNVIPLGFYLLLTTRARKHWGWLIALAVCYIFDGLLSLMGKDWISLAVHVYVLYLFWQGLSAAFAARNLERMPSSQAA